MNILPLDSAKNQLESVIGAAIGTLDPDGIDAVVHGLQWREIPEEVDNDESMAALLGLSSVQANTELVVVTDASFDDPGGAFVTTVKELASLYTDHFVHFGERVFSGSDVIIWAPTEKTLWIVHHEGVFTSKNLSVIKPSP